MALASKLPLGALLGQELVSRVIRHNIAVEYMPSGWKFEYYIHALSYDLSSETVAIVGSRSLCGRLFFNNFR